MSDLFVKSVRRPLWVVGLLSLSWGLSGCSSLKSATETLGNVGNIVTPYRIDIIQGNFVSREQAAAVAVGMPKSQVRDILGTPLLMSVFHADRWDYVFTFRRPGQAVQQRRLTAFFKGDLLERIESDELPTEAEFVASLDTRKREGKTPVLEASEESLKAFAAQRKPAEADLQVPPVPPISNYPPLEPPAGTPLR
ncbi:MAG TPA: outer membrane protein assembly factor BamE [Burkholderiaceae bacterium]|nr:outer membrane protein assembly factor BamE [Burkholderiaceae bacterium]